MFIAEEAKDFNDRINKWYNKISNNHFYEIVKNNILIFVFQGDHYIYNTYVRCT